MLLIKLYKQNTLPQKLQNSSFDSFAHSVAALHSAPTALFSSKGLPAPEGWATKSQSTVKRPSLFLNTCNILQAEMWKNWINYILGRAWIEWYSSSMKQGCRVFNTSLHGFSKAPHLTHKRDTPIEPTGYEVCSFLICFALNLLSFHALLCSASAFGHELRNPTHLKENNFMTFVRLGISWWCSSPSC